VTVADARDEITRIIEKAEKAAYKRGWADCRETILHAANDAMHLVEPPSDERAAQSSDQIRGQFTVIPLGKAESPKRGRPSGKAIDIVANCIASTPGMKGVEVVRAAQEIDPKIPERTVRTCLRRLRENKAIWKRSGLWYPKPKQGTESTNASAEPAATSPH
jgi:hypothetical protein